MLVVGTFPDFNPFNDELVADISAGGKTEAEAAVAAAAAAFPDGRSFPRASASGSSSMSLTSLIGDYLTSLTPWRSRRGQVSLSPHFRSNGHPI